MLQNIAKSIASLRHKAIWWLMLASIAATIFLLLGFIWMVDQMLTVYSFGNILWVEKLIENSGLLAAVLLSWFLFPVTVPAIASLFEDKVAMVVEQNEYGQLGQSYSYPWIKEISFLLQGILYNIILLPVYVIPGLNIFVYYLLNSWLVGKGLFMLMATRYHTQAGAKQLWERHGLTIKLYGAFLVFLSNIPLLNLIAPLFGVIVMVHYSRSLVLTK